MDEFVGLLMFMGPNRMETSARSEPIKRPPLALVDFNFKKSCRVSYGHETQELNAIPVHLCGINNVKYSTNNYFHQFKQKFMH